MLSILYTALTMFVAGLALTGGMLSMQGIVKKATVAIVKYKLKKNNERS